MEACECSTLEVMQVLPQGTLRYQGRVPLTQLPSWAQEMQYNHTRIKREITANRQRQRGRRKPVAMEKVTM